MTTTPEQLKIEGLELAASKYLADLIRATQIAEVIAVLGPITTDDVREAFEDHQGRPLEVGNALGQIFRNKKKWEFVDRVKSTRLAAHSRYICRWRLKRKESQQSSEVPEVGTVDGVRFCRTCSQETEDCTCEPNSQLRSEKRNDA